MKYEMPVLTDEQRKSAISGCIAEIAHLERRVKAHPDQPVIKIDMLVHRIALAALTAEPRGSLIQSVNPLTGTVAIFYRECGINSICPEDIEEWEMSELDSLYGAPPVPALKQHKAVAAALEGLQWPNAPIGNKVIIKAAIEALNGGEGIGGDVSTL